MEENRSKSLWPWVRQGFLRYNIKSTIHKRKSRLNGLKVKNLYCLKDTLTIMERQVTEWEKKYLQNVYLRKDFNPEYIFSKLNNNVNKPIKLTKGFEQTRYTDGK